MSPSSRWPRSPSFSVWDLVDDDGADVTEVLPGPECVVDPLVGTDDHVGVRVEAVSVVVHPQEPTRIETFSRSP